MFFQSKKEIKQDLSHLGMIKAEKWKQIHKQTINSKLFGKKLKKLNWKKRLYKYSIQQNTEDRKSITEITVCQVENAIKL